MDRNSVMRRVSQIEVTNRFKRPDVRNSFELAASAQTSSCGTVFWYGLAARGTSRMVIHRIRHHVETHNWFAVLVDLAIVVVGVFLGVQATRWNDRRIEQAQSVS